MVALLGGACGDSGPDTGLEVLVDLSGGPLGKLTYLKVIASRDGGFAPLSETNYAEGVTASSDGTDLIVTFGPGYNFTTTVTFLLAVETGLPLDVTLVAEAQDAAGETIGVSTPVTETVQPGRRVPVPLVVRCLVPEACTPVDGGVDGPTNVPTADEAAHFVLRGGAVGTSSLAVKPVANALVCRTRDSGPSDLIVGVPRADGLFANTPSRGRVLVYRGQGRTWSGALSLESPDVTVVGAANGHQLGTTLACADFDGDGREDLVLGAPNGGTSHAGAVYVVFNIGTMATGTTVNLGDLSAGELDEMTLVDGPGSEALAGTALASPAFQGSRPWLAVGAPGDASGAGAVHLLPPALLTRGTSVVLGTGVGPFVEGPQVDAALGSALAAGPLTNAAGPHDLAMAAPAASGPGAGAVYVLADGDVVATLDGGVEADGGGLDLSAGLTITGPVDVGFAEALAVGDLDHDNIADLLIGAPRATFAGRDGAGVVYLVKGGSALFTSDAIDLAASPEPSELRAVLGGPLAQAHFGTSLAVVTSGTSLQADLLVGAPGVEMSRGMAFLVGGAPGLERNVDTATSAAVTFSVLGEAGAGRFGAAVAAGSLEDADTIGDLVVVAPAALDESETVGAVYGFLDGQAQ